MFKTAVCPERSLQPEISCVLEMVQDSDVRSRPHVLWWLIVFQSFALPICIHEWMPGQAGGVLHDKHTGSLKRVLDGWA